MKELSILGRTIQIKTCNKRELAEFDDSKDLMGWYASDEATIYIYSGLSGEAYNRTLLHEVAHAMLGISGLAQLFAAKQEEAVCDLAEAYLDLFKNKKLVEFLNE